MRLRKNSDLRNYLYRLIAAFTVVCVLLLCGSAEAFAAEKGLNVESHSQDEIREYMEQVYADTDFAVKFKDKPIIEGSAYSAGTLSQETLQGALSMLNGLRFIAGVPATVRLDEKYNVLCQAGALINCVNQEMSHHPARPIEMSEELYRLGYKGCSSSNLYWNVNNFKEAVTGWVSDEYNLSADPGHRRWCLNPKMGSTGFGKVGAYSAMYAFDQSNAAAANYTGVAWPAQQMPVNYFNPRVQWSISFGRNINQSAVEVTLTQNSGQKVWRFSDSQSDGQFFVSNARYGQSGCVVFRPNEVKAYKSGDVYHVTIKENGNVIADYDVNFFDLVKTPDRVKLTSLKSVNTHGIKVVWAKGECSGYQIRYSTSKSFKSWRTITIKDCKTLSKTIKKLRQGKTYYAKVRAYNEGFDKRVYGSFSTAWKTKCNR